METFFRHLCAPLVKLHTLRAVVPTVFSRHDVDLLAPGPRAQPVVGLHDDAVLGVLLQVGEGEGEAVLGGGAEGRRVDTVALLLKGTV